MTPWHGDGSPFATASDEDDEQARALQNAQGLNSPPRMVPIMAPIPPPALRAPPRARRAPSRADPAAPAPAGRAVRVIADRERTGARECSVTYMATGGCRARDSAAGCRG